MSNEKCKREYSEIPLPPSTGAPCDLGIDCGALRDKDARLLSRAMGGGIESRELPDGAYEHAVKETLMQWTTEFPAKPGFYWVRNYVRRWTRSNIHPGPELVQLVPWELAPEAGWRVLGVGHSGVEIDGIASAEWYGPMEPPE